MASFVYDNAKELIADGTIDLEGHVLRLALLSASHTPDKANHTQFSNVSANEIAGSGYTAGGEVVLSVAVSRSGAVVKVDAPDVEWAALAPDFRYVVLYDDTAVGDPLIALLDPAALQQPGGQDTKVVFHASGIFTLTDA